MSCPLSVDKYNSTKTKCDSMLASFIKNIRLTSQVKSSQFNRAQTNIVHCLKQRRLQYIYTEKSMHIKGTRIYTFLSTHLKVIQLSASHKNNRWISIKKYTFCSISKIRIRFNTGLNTFHFLGRESKKNGVVLNKYSILVFRRILYTLYSLSIVQLYSV